MYCYSLVYQESFTTLQCQEDVGAILDLKWSYQPLGQKQLLAQVDANGALRLYQLELERAGML
jgi:hypothetical protein